jgi:hypothetical protein
MLYRGLRFADLRKTLPDAPQSIGSRAALPVSGSTKMQCLDTPQLLEKLGFFSHFPLLHDRPSLNAEKIVAALARKIAHKTQAALLQRDASHLA